ncbi:PfkB domain-containing protein [Psidium guajava]|nr:PfkB domain-containing protein [Psidium guajava]
MSKLGGKPFLISAVGLDMAGSHLLEHWRSTGRSSEGILQTQDITTAVVCCVLDPNGEVAAGVASFESIEKFLTAEWIQQFRYKISSAPVVMVDANLNDHALEASCRLAAGDNIPLWFEPVSVAKSKKIAPLVKYVTYVSPNEEELFAMADALSPGKLYGLSERYKREKNCPPESLIKMLIPAIILLLEKGVKIVVVTIGARGIFLCSKEGSILTRAVVEKPQPLGITSELHRLISSDFPLHKFHAARQIEGTSHFFALHLPGLPASVKKLTGAGDCLVGATLASICEGSNIIQAISVGIAAAKATVEADLNVPSTFDLIGVADDARLVYLAAKVVYDGPV